MQPSSRKRFVTSLTLVVCGSILFFIFRQVADSSSQFEQETNGVDRPIISVLRWFVIAFVIYFCAWMAAGGLATKRFIGHGDRVFINLAIVVGFGILFRLTMTCSTPIQEIDLYRYIWDGGVVASGHDPYQYSPATVLLACNKPATVAERENLAELLKVVQQRPGLKKVLETIHFGDYTTPYPPTSQLFFAAAVGCTKQRGDARDYVIAIKTMLVLFDVATGVLVILLLVHVGMSPILSIAYWWCPLVIKEIANSGHLDSIATFFAVLAIYLTTRAMWPRNTGDEEVQKIDEVHGRKRIWFNAIPAAVALAAAVAAKVFPIVLFPIWALVLLRRQTIPAICSIAVFLMATIGICWPMIRHLEVTQKIAPGLAVQRNGNEIPDRSGIEAFSRYWEMNDFVFMLVVENIKPTASINDPVPWFRFTSDRFREQASERFAIGHVVSKTIMHSTITKAVGLFGNNQRDIKADQPATQHTLRNYAFFATRAITMGLFGLIVIWTGVMLVRHPDPLRWLEMSFLTLAWFWLLSPTQNPWYWTWAMPLLAFARGRTWFLISGVLFAYYLRFWFGFHFDSVDVCQALNDSHPTDIYNWIFPWSKSFPYTGTTFFDFYVPWYEFAPCLTLLFVAWLVRLLVRPARILSVGDSHP